MKKICMKLWSLITPVKKSCCSTDSASGFGEKKMEFGKYRIGKTDYGNRVIYFVETNINVDFKLGTKPVWVKSFSSLDSLEEAKRMIDGRIEYDNLPPPITTYIKYP